MGYIGMCDFSAVLVINRVCFFAGFVKCFFFGGGYIFKRNYFLIIIDKTTNKRPSNIMFRATVCVSNF